MPRHHVRSVGRILISGTQSGGYNHVEKWFEDQWGLVLGSSSGFGLATCKELARRGMNIFGVHFDRKSAMEQINRAIDEMKSQGVKVHFFNFNAADEEKRIATIQEIRKEIGGDKPLKVMMHSLAFGTLKLYFADNPDDEITQTQMDMTCNVMAHSLVYWARDLRREKLLGKGSRIYAMTSAGGHVVWPNYGAVSAAKAALESHIRQIALELGPLGVCANSICAGVTDTPALRKIPGHDNLIKNAQANNPSGRLTTPEDVAKAISLLTRPEADFITGNVINVDGGEDIVG